MTACMYIQPQGVGGSCTLMLADTMATRDQPELPVITPAVRTYENARAPSRVAMVRKLYILNERTIIAFAGNDLREITQCLDAVEGALPAILRGQVPMDRLADVVNQYPGVDSVAATILPGGRVDMMSRPGQRFRTTTLGECAAIGSGGPALKRRAQELDGRVAQELRLAPIPRATGFAQNVASICLAKEIGDEHYDWGACIEYAYAEEGGARWVRGPKTLHEFCMFVPLDDRRATVRFLGRQLAYDPGGGEGRLLSLSRDSNRNGLIEDLVIENVLDRSLALDRLASAEFWNGWRPERYSIAMLVGRDDGVVASVTNDYPGNAANLEMVWRAGERGPDTFRWNVSNDLYHDFFSGALAAMSLEYVPAEEAFPG